MPEIVPVNIYINNYENPITREITPGVTSTIDIAADPVLSNYFYHCDSEFIIPIINQLMFDFLDPANRTTIIATKVVNIVRDLRYQLYTNLLPQPGDTKLLIPKSWKQVFDNNYFNIGYYSPLQFNVHGATNMTLLTVMSNSVLNDIFQNLWVGYELTYVDATTETTKKKYISRTYINSINDINHSWHYGNSFWNDGLEHDRCPFNETNRESLTTTYQLSDSLFHNYSTQEDWFKPHYISIDPAPTTAFPADTYITKCFGVDYDDIKNNTYIEIAPIVFNGPITNYQTPINGFAYFTNTVGDVATRSFKKHEEVIETIMITNTERTYNPEILNDNGYSWLGEYNPEITNDTSLDIDITLKEE